MVRQQAGSTVGLVWLVKVALDDGDVAAAFEARWKHATATMERHRMFLKSDTKS